MYYDIQRRFIMHKNIENVLTLICYGHLFFYISFISYYYI